MALVLILVLCALGAGAGVLACLAAWQQCIYCGSPAAVCAGVCAICGERQAVKR